MTNSTQTTTEYLAEHDGYSRDDLRRLHQELDAECEARGREAQDAAREYRVVSRKRNVAHHRFMAAQARRGLIRRMLAEIEQPGRYDDSLSTEGQTA